LGQVADRGLVPRLSIGTRQLSIRCSSVHFGPSRSFPVNRRRNVSVAALLAGLGVAFSAVAYDVNAISANALTIPDGHLMETSLKTAFRHC